MGKTAKSWLTQGLRWCIAILGIGYVLSNMSWSSQVLVTGPGGWPVAKRLASDSSEDASQFNILENGGAIRAVPRDQLLARVDFARVKVRINGDVQSRDLLAQPVMDHIDRARWPYVVCAPRSAWQRYWNVHTSAPQLIEPAQIIGKQPAISRYPLVVPGIGPMLQQSNFGPLLAAFFILPITLF